MGGGRRRRQHVHQREERDERAARAGGAAGRPAGGARSGEEDADERGRGLQQRQLEAEQGQGRLARLQRQQADEPTSKGAASARAGFRDSGCRSRVV